LTVGIRGEKKNWKTKKIKKTEPWKKQIKILKKPIGSVRFYEPETEKTEPNPNKKKPSQTKKNRAKLVWIGFFPKKSNRIETGWFEPILVFLKKKLVWLLFL